MIHTEDKPPLTRRWTDGLVPEFVPVRQTSAHAEMDPTTSYHTRPRATNLRSRGDGPPPGLFFVAQVRKPPLTRRWTFLRRRRPSRDLQTSAHAEMDLLSKSASKFLQANLRSRGDGPSKTRVFSCHHSKPPLTRRWTQLTVLTKRLFKQTSAHAEMDPST